MHREGCQRSLDGVAEGVAPTSVAVNFGTGHDRIIHHADVITLKGSSYRLRINQIETVPSAQAENQAH